MVPWALPMALRAPRRGIRSAVRASGFEARLSRTVSRAQFSREARVALLEAVQTASEACAALNEQGDPIVVAWLGQAPQNPAELEFRALQARFAARRDLLQHCIGTRDVVSLLGLRNRQTPLDRIKAGTLLAIRDQGQWQFPLWQFDPDGPDGVIAGLPQVLAALPVAEFTKAQWLQRPQPVFEGQTPLELLRQGQLERVLKEARALDCGQG